MPVKTTLPLSPLAAVTVTISAAGAVAPSFNQGLFIGTSPVISTVGANSRLRLYNVGSWATEMLADGFAADSAEYIAMGIYFGQQPAPQYGYVGRRDLTAVGAFAIEAPGAGYVVNDVVTVQGAGNGAQIKITAVDGTGAVTAASFIPGAQGTGYQVANAVATAGGSGGGFAVNITAIGETVLQAVAACRIASSAWYAVAVDGAEKADHLAVLQYAQGAQPPMKYHGNTADPDALTGAAGNVLAEAKAAGYGSGMLSYSTTQGGLAPNNVYAAAGHMGRAMGLNTGLAGSYFTMKFKDITGIVAEPLSVDQVNVIEGQNGNVLLDYANGSYTIFEQGVCPDGQYYDEVINVDMIVANLQTNTVNEFVSQRAIPLTNAGQQSMLKAANRAGDTAASIGFVQPGTWNGQTITGANGNVLLAQGAPLPLGYLAVSDSFANQNPADKKARRMMPVYLCIIEGEAGHSAIIGLNVQQ